MTNWDDAFDNVGHVPNALDHFDAWKRRAAEFVRSARADFAMAYGTGERQELDLFWPDRNPEGLVVFVHGGYWTKLDRSYFSHLAAGPVAKGLAVAIPSYTLAPAARINEITQEIAQAISFSAARVSGQVRLVGHSAGGHLVTRMVSDNALLPESIQNRIAKTVSISGLHDLRNLVKTKLNEQLRLTSEEAERESTCLAVPFPQANVTCWVGGDERPEFIRQTHLLQTRWQNYCQIDEFIEPGKHHFNVIDALNDPEAKLTRSLLA